jgi:trk system potassium uptake protein TrkH
MLLLKNALKELRSISHPRSIKVLKFDGRVIPDETMRGTLAFLTLYVTSFCVSLLIVSADKTDMVSNISGVIATLNNIGPGFGICGATGNFSSFSNLSKIVFIADMLLGRLELFPLICLFIPPRNRAKLTLFGKELRKK